MVKKRQPGTRLTAEQICEQILPTTTPNKPAHEMRLDVAKGMPDGTTCPVCAQRVKDYDRTLNVPMVETEIWLVRLHPIFGRFLHIPTEAPSESIGNREYGRLHNWGLAKKLADESAADANPHEPKQTTSGKWRPTQKGIDFVDGLIKVPKQLFFYNKTVIGETYEQVSVYDVLGGKKEHANLMGRNIFDWAVRRFPTKKIKEHVDNLMHAAFKHDPAGGLAVSKIAEYLNHHLHWENQQAVRRARKHVTDLLNTDEKERDDGKP